MYDFLTSYSWAPVLTLSVTHKPRCKSNKAISISLNWKPTLSIRNLCQMNELLLYVCMKTHAQKFWFETIKTKLAQKNSPILARDFVRAAMMDPASTALYLRGNGKDVACVMLVEIICHLSWRFVFSTVSQPTCCCHSCCMRIFARIVTGDMNPSGSKMLEDHRRISRLVVTDEIAGFALGAR